MTPPQPARPPSIRRNFATRCRGGGRDLALILSGRQAGSADWRRVLNSTLVPKRIEPPGDRQRRAGAHIAIEGFAVISDDLDDPYDPILGQAQLLAEIAVGPENAFHLRLVGFHHLVD